MATDQMVTVQAPEGYEGCRFYDDAIRAYRASARPIGATWWTNAILCDLPVHLPAEELNARAERAIRTAVSLGMVR
jgi:hypothetical protein